jgi:O-antigen/teichoic acid export membrane protein
MAVTSGRTANSLLWSAVENGSLAIISFGSLIVFSRLLSASDFGLFSVVSAIAELLGIVVTLLFHDALVQRPEINDYHFDSAFTVGCIISLVLLAGCWLFATPFEHLVRQPGAGNVLGCMGFTFPCLALSATIVARQRREFGFKALAIRSLAGRILGGVAAVVAALWGAGVWSLVFQQVVTALVGSIALWVTCERLPRLRFRFTEFRQLLTFGLLSLGSVFLSFSIKRLFTIFAGLLLGVATAGYLNLGFRVVDVFWSVSATAVSQVSLPMLAGLQTDRARMKRAYQRSVEYACLLLYPCFVGIAVTAPELVTIVFGKHWSPVVPCVAALAVLVLAQAPRLFTTPVLTAVGRPRDPLIGVAFELVFMLTMIGVFGLHSLMWATLLWIACECTQIPISTWMLRRATGFDLADQFGGAVTPLLASMTLACAVLAARRMLPPDLGLEPRLAILVIVGVAAYLVALVLLNRALVSTFLAFVRSAFVKVNG